MAKAKMSALDHLKKVALRCEASSGAKIAELAETVTAAIEELAGQKADKAAKVPITIPVTAWKANADAATKAAGFAFYADAAVAGLTAQDSADTVLDFPSLEPAKVCGMATTATPMAAAVRYYAVEKPTTALTAQVRVIQGATQ